MISTRLDCRPPWLAAVTVAAGLGVILGVVAGLPAIVTPGSAAGGGPIVSIAALFTVLAGGLCAALAIGAWLRRRWARPLGLVAGPALGAVAVLDGVFAIGALLSPVAILGVALAAVILVGLARPEVRLALGGAVRDDGRPPVDRA